MHLMNMHAGGSMLRKMYTYFNTKTVLLHHAGANRFVRETGSDKEYAALILRFIGLQYIGIELLFCLSVFN